MRLERTLVLVGMMGSGKTAVGSALAACLGVGFTDSDREIEAAAQLSIAEIFERYGEAFFRDKEAQVLARLLAGQPQVLATGGGAFMRAENREAIARAGAVSVWLDVPLEVLWRRVRHKTTRPLLRTDDPRGTLSRLLAERAPVYALADVRVSAIPETTVPEMARRVCDAVARARPDALVATEEPT